jgi:hypothetical protein
MLATDRIKAQNGPISIILLLEIYHRALIFNLKVEMYDDRKKYCRR